MFPDHPIVVVLGATGAGKSKLAIDIATRLNGEIISADSMQVYKGLDIITNKVTNEEQSLCRHHLIGFLDPLKEYNIHQFQEEATNIIANIHKRKKLPILVGGTNYYMQAVLWSHLIKDRNDLPDKDAYKYRQELERIDAVTLYEKLNSVDPDHAARLHPQDKRKVIRALEGVIKPYILTGNRSSTLSMYPLCLNQGLKKLGIWELYSSKPVHFTVFHRTNKKVSEYLTEQKNMKSEQGSLLKYNNICGLWVDCDPDVLNDRINKRVDKMCEQGLINELQDFHKQYNEQRLEEGLNPDYEHGIFQSIGFKEFHEFLTTSSDEPDQVKECLKLEAIERMKITTRQYARYQIKWINKKVLHCDDGFPLYKLDATDPSLWHSKVLLPSLVILKTAVRWRDHVENVNEKCIAFSNDNLGNIIAPERLKPIIRKLPTVSRHTCNICQNKPVFVFEEMWLSHIKSKNHRHQLKRLKNEEKLRKDIKQSKTVQHQNEYDIDSASFYKNKDLEFQQTEDLIKEEIVDQEDYGQLKQNKV